MPPHHFQHETAQSVQHVSQGLPGARFGIKYDEVDRMPLVKGDADLRLLLEATDSGAMSRPRIDDDDWRFRRIEAVVETMIGKTRDAQQSLVGRVVEPPCVDNEFVVEIQERRLACTLMGQEVVRPLAQGIEEQD